MDMMQLLQLLQQQNSQNNPLLPKTNPYGMSPQGFDFANSPFPSVPPANSLPPRNRSDLEQSTVELPSLEEVTVPDREERSGLLPSMLEEIEVDKEKVSGQVDVPFYKDNDRMAMIMAALSEGFGGMTLKGSSGMEKINHATYANAMKNIQGNKTMDYLIKNNPEQAKALMALPPGLRNKAMNAAIESQFSTNKPSAFAEKYGIIKATMKDENGNPISDADALEMALSPSSVTNINTGSATNALGNSLGEAAGEWLKTGATQSSGNRAEAARVIDSLEMALANGQDLTGNVASFLPESARAVFDAEGLDAQQSVERIVQQSLKATLGAQFAQKEAEQLLARTWNPRLPTDVNLRRTRRLLAELDAHSEKMNLITRGIIANGGDVMAYLSNNPEALSTILGDDIYGLQFDDVDVAGSSQSNPIDI